MMEHLVVVVLGLTLVIEKVGSLFVQRAAARERKELYDRLQAGTLADYTSLVERPTGRRGDTVTRGLDEEQVTVEELTGYREEAPESAFVEAQAGFNLLMK